VSIIPETSRSAAHPSWCDPRFCQTLGTDNIDHRSAPTTWEVNADEVVVHVGLSQLEELGPIPDQGEIRVILTLEHLELRKTVECDLSSADGRMIAAALGVAVEQRDAIARLASVLR
jgi:hypothetical protein